MIFAPPPKKKKDCDEDCFLFKYRYYRYSQTLKVMEAAISSSLNRNALLMKAAEHTGHVGLPSGFCTPVCLHLPPTEIPFDLDLSAFVGSECLLLSKLPS